MNAIKITWEQVKELLPDKTYLSYVDYRDSLDGIPEVLARCVKENSMDPLWEHEMDNSWLGDQEWEAITEIKKELQDDLVRRYDIEEDEAEDLVDVEFDDHIRDYCYDNDESTPIQDLLRNTDDLIMFYDTGLEFDGYGRSEAEFRLDRMRLKKALQVTSSQYDDDIEMMMNQASYGGQLVVYFKTPMGDMITNKDYPSIRFRNPHIAIIDTMNGSGDNTFLKGHEFTISFDRGNLFVEKTIKYNYTYEVCGMVGDWCDETEISFIEEEVGTVEASPLNAQMEQDNKYKAVYLAGKCSAGDMDYTRHRNVTYINNFPCGNKCLDCGTFWID